jgi:hypothetical protein
MSDIQKAEKEKPSALSEVPAIARETVETIIQRPGFLARLLIEEAERLELYAEEPANHSSLSGNYDTWGNPVSVSVDCIGKAKYYRRVAKELSLKRYQTEPDKDT